MDDPSFAQVAQATFEQIFARLSEISDETNEKIEELEKVLASLVIGLFGLSGLVDSMFKVLSKDPENAELLDYNMTETMQQILEMANNAGATGVGDNTQNDPEPVEDLASES